MSYRVIPFTTVQQRRCSFCFEENAHGRSEVVQKYATELWNMLFEETGDNLQEGSRAVISECLGKLALSNPTVYVRFLF
jgi:hypothetical protein